jgi:hypothetical protein
MYVSRSFPIIYHGDKVSLNSSVVFHIQVDDVSEPKGGIDASNPAHDYQDAHLEFTLGFSNDVYVLLFSYKRSDDAQIVPVQTKFLRIQDVFLPNTLSKPIILHYHSLEFNDVYSSMVDVIISQSAIGYIKKQSLEIDAQLSSRKSVWNWFAKKLNINNSIEPKESEYVEKSSTESWHLNDFPMPVLRLENSLDHLITLQHIIHQVVFDLSMYADQIMSTSYVYEHIYNVLNQSEIQLHHGRQININIRQEMYSEITQMVKRWLTGCNDRKAALSKIEDVIQCIANLVYL